ncbi:MAG: SOS response-associated peptidase [Thermoanaerobaculia bacterium]|nr:SOS response-associated peptidase [Thermoanaerobaculia bacterium]
MCGRYTLSTPGALLQERFDLDHEPESMARYNIAPTQEAPVIVATAQPGLRHLETMRWGLVPAFAKDPTQGARAINARSETVASRPSFRDSFATRRCLVPADGFYEWQGRGGAKQPFHARRRDLAPFAFAGLWAEWRERSTDTPLRTYTIITCPPNELLSTLHDRMPVVLPSADFSPWLDEETDAEELRSLLVPAPEDAWEVVPVSSRVNSVRNDDPSCLGPPEQSLLF